MLSVIREAVAVGWSWSRRSLLVVELSLVGLELMSVGFGAVVSVGRRTVLELLSDRF